MGVWSSRASVQLLGSCFRTRTVTQDKMHPPASELVAMTDAFEGIDRLAEGVEELKELPTSGDFLDFRYLVLVNQRSEDLKKFLKRFWPSMVTRSMYSG